MPGSHDEPECPPHDWELVEMESEIEVEKEKRGMWDYVYALYLVHTKHYEDDRCGETKTEKHRHFLTIISPDELPN